MIERINAYNNTHFYFLNYSPKNFQVLNFIVIPKHYFVDNIIEKRKPLNVIARRAGWVGCNILLDQIPSTGKIYLVKNGELQNKKVVLETWAKTIFLEKKRKETRSWLIEIMRLLEKIPATSFNLSEMYSFENYLREKFPNNKFIRDKIRQQLQVLRDKGLLEFKGNGRYKKI
jgi:type II restriction enzyme